MTQTNTLLPSPAIRPVCDRSRALVSLIEVPEVKGGPMPRVDTHAYGRVNSPRVQRRFPTGRRRRLRREVRIAGCAVLLLAPLISACTVGWSTGPVRVLACSITEATAPDRAADVQAGASEPGARSSILPNDSPGDVVLSTEPALKSSGNDAEPPVIFPGYVLPDDTLEGPAHEGS